MEKKEVNVTIRTTVSFKSELVTKAKELGMSLSDFGETSLRTVLLKEQVSADKDLEIDALKNDVKVLREELLVQKNELEFTKLLKANNEVHLRNIDELREQIRVKEDSLETQKVKIKKQKENYKTALNIVKNYVQENHKSNFMLMDFFENQSLKDLLNLASVKV